LTNDHNFELLRSVITVNNRQRHLPLYALRQRFGGLDGLRVGVFGLAFKPGTDDVREAPSLDLINVLAEEGVTVKAFDPKAAHSVEGAIPKEVRLTDDPLECASRCHALVLMTEWPEIVNSDWKEISRCASPPRFLFDGRNALDPVKMQSYGFEYAGVGRNIARPVNGKSVLDSEDE
jgi:UDPglucose 6-dehydrogenase